MKLNIESGEKYPHLFVGEPFDDYSREHGLEVPDDLGSAVLTAQKALREAELALLIWLRDSPDTPIPPTADVLRNFLYADEDQ